MVRQRLGEIFRAAGRRDFENRAEGQRTLGAWSRAHYDWCVRKGLFLALLPVWAMQTLAGCASGPRDELTLGAYCQSDSRCPGGYCLDRACSKHCESDA